MQKPLRTGYLTEDEVSVKFEDDPRGNLRIYEKPGDPCVIGSDVAEGIEQDESASVVLNCETNATMAVFNSGKIDPDQFARFNMMLGTYFAWGDLKYPLIGVERNSVGFSVVSDLLKIYPKRYIYFHNRMDERRKVQTKKFGWWTSEHTRHLMLSHLKEEIREGSTDLRDRILIQQCLMFQNIDGKPQAPEGELDDVVLSRAIAGEMKRHRPVRAKIEFPVETPKFY